MSSDSSSPVLPSPLPSSVYRLVSAAAWKDTYETTGAYKGSEHDWRDGYIHMSPKEQVRETDTHIYTQVQPIYNDTWC